jgi:flavin reductase (DIM6/NTAB) family NADH-FMN oxidoreductase RutF
MTATVHHVPDTGLQHDFRAAMGNVAGGVVVATTHDDRGPHGTTVSAFTSLSIDPPMVLVALDVRSSLLDRLEVGSPLGVNVLAAHQDQVALRFATKGRDRFADVGWSVDQGAPALDDRHAWIVGRVARLVEGGDHVVVLVDVVHAEAGAQAPLTYWRRTFGTHHAF